MKKLVGIILAVVACSCMYAKQLAIQVVQHSDAWTSVGESSLVVEDELLNGFFDYGCIVTNSNASVSCSPEEDDELFHTGFGEAYDGFSDVFVQVKLYFKALNTNPDKIKTDMNPSRLEHADLVMMNVKTGKIILEQVITGSTKKTDTSDNVNAVIKSLITAIKKAL